jgi:capsular polysaccharide biosynthesis protein
MTIAPRPDTFELADYLGVLRRRWWIAVLLAAVGLLGSAAYVKVAPKEYTATAAVYVSATAANNNQALGRTSGPVNMDNEAQIAQSQSVAVLAARQLHSPLSPQDLVKKVTVSVPPNTTVLDISCTQSTRHGAQECANDFASAYLANRLATSTAAISSAVTALQAKEARLIAQLSRLKARIHSLSPTSATRATEEMQHDAAVGELTQVETQVSNLVPALASLQAPNNTLAGHVITPAVRPASPSSPRKLLLLPSGLLAGLFIGLLAVFIAERRDKRVHTAAEVERELDLPVLLSIPPKRPVMKAAVATPRTSIGQAFHDLAQHVAASLGDGRHILIVATTGSGMGGSAVTANLAAALARTRSEVLVVCPDLRGSSIPGMLDVPEDGRGLTDVVAGIATIREVTRRSAEVPGLGVVLPGTDGSTVLSDVQNDVLHRVASELRSDASYVIVEAPADGYDAFVLAEFADAAIVTVELNGTMRPEAAGCIQRLEQLRTAVLGATVAPRLRDPAAPRSRPSAPRPRAALADPEELLVVDSRAGLAEAPGPHAMLERGAAGADVARSGGPELPPGASAEPPATRAGLTDDELLAPFRSGETWPPPEVREPGAADWPTRRDHDTSDPAGKIARAERRS